MEELCSQVPRYLIWKQTLKKTKKQAFPAPELHSDAPSAQSGTTITKAKRKGKTQLSNPTFLISFSTATFFSHSHYFFSFLFPRKNSHHQLSSLSTLTYFLL